MMGWLMFKGDLEQLKNLKSNRLKYNLLDQIKTSNLT